VRQIDKHTFRGKALVCCSMLDHIQAAAPATASTVHGTSARVLFNSAQLLFVGAMMSSTSIACFRSLIGSAVFCESQIS